MKIIRMSIHTCGMEWNGLDVLVILSGKGSRRMEDCDEQNAPCYRLEVMCPGVALGDSS